MNFSSIQQVKQKREKLKQLKQVEQQAIKQKESSKYGTAEKSPPHFSLLDNENEALSPRFLEDHRARDEKYESEGDFRSMSLGSEEKQIMNKPKDTVVEGRQSPFQNSSRR